MASTNIAIKEDAYRFLKSLKGNNKSFSDVILDFKKEDKGILRFFGVLKNVKKEEWSARESEMKKLRDEFEEKL